MVFKEEKVSLFYFLQLIFYSFIDNKAFHEEDKGSHEEVASQQSRINSSLSKETSNNQFDKFGYFFNDFKFCNLKVFQTEIELKESLPREEKSINPVAEPQINLDQSKII